MILYVSIINFTSFITYLFNEGLLTDCYSNRYAGVLAAKMTLYWSVSYGFNLIIIKKMNLSLNVNLCKLFFINSKKFSYEN